MSQKVLVLGGIDGQLKPAFGKLKALHSKHNFSFALVVGDLFAASHDEDTASDLLAGRIEVPVTTYFTVGQHPLHQSIIHKIISNEEICENLVFLDKRSVTKTSDGVRIVTLSGIRDASNTTGISKEQYVPYHTDDDAKSLKGANSADILLTTLWPANVWRGSRAALPFNPEEVETSDRIADLCAALRPSYHIAPSPKGTFFYEREPFFYPPKDGVTDAPKQITRFISMGAFGNDAKAKSMYAFTLQTSVDTLPVGSTASPFTTGNGSGRKRLAEQDDVYSRFSNDTNPNPNRANKGRKGRRGERLPPPGPEDCFLCLASTRAENHMITSIGDDSYVATAKGPLTKSTTFLKLGFKVPAHLLIAPQGHHPTISKAAMGDELAATTLKEMTRLRGGLQAMVSNLSKYKLGAVTWEISRAANIHAHWQFLPCPAVLIKKKHVEAAFRVEAENLNLPKLINKDFSLADDVQGDFIRIWIWCEDDGDGDGDDGKDVVGDRVGGDGGSIISKCLLMRFDESVRFDLQYPRKVMAKLLGLDDRTIWQDCVQTTEDETEDAGLVREAFRPWDFTMA